ncbi:MAG: glycosyltransferase family 39 protein [Actinomycetota bacterium]|nr:glycosyltransferase family 39 protein [Actinomycetota bacterium]
MLVFAVVARFTARSHLWLDEALSVNIARLPLGELPEALRHDGAPPLYSFLLHGWMKVFGTSEMAVRALSGLFAVATLPLMWVAGRRLGGRRMAWAAVLLLAASPFAVRYATEARMYSLIALLVLVGYLALTDLLRRFSWPAAVGVAVSTGLLMLTHYWSFFLLAVVVAMVGWRARRSAGRSEARRALVAMAAGTVLFLPWAPSFVYQMRNTGTPWAGRPDLGTLFDTVTRFSGGPWEPGFALTLISYGLIALAVLGRSVDRRRIELDLRTRPGGRHLAVVVFGTLLLATAVGMITGSAYAVRYAAVVAPLFVLLVALGTRVFEDPRVFRGVLAVAVVLGVIAVIPNMVGERTTAAKVAAAIAARAQPGDVVAYCPDQLGPSVSRHLPEQGLVHVTFPTSDLGPERIEWVGYEARNRAARTAPFADLLLSRAGPANDIWLVWSPGYRTFSTKCSALADRLEQARPDMTRVVKVKSKVFEHPGLIQYRPA